MPAYVALLRAVNVGGTGKLPMAELRRLCVDAGFEGVRTYIASGNVVFRAALPVDLVRRLLEDILEPVMGKRIAVHVRTPAELAAIVAENPFSDAAGNRLLVMFLDQALPPDALASVVIPGRVAFEARGCEVYVHYPDGMGRSKQKLPLGATATGRNLNTVRKLLDMGRALQAADGLEPLDPCTSS